LGNWILKGNDKNEKKPGNQIVWKPGYLEVSISRPSEARGIPFSAYDRIDLINRLILKYYMQLSCTKFLKKLNNIISIG